MQFVIAAYWPYLIGALLAGAAVGWWNHDRRSIDDLTAWLERGFDEP